MFFNLRAILCICIQSTFADYLGHGPDAACDYRDSATHCLGNRHSEAFMFCGLYICAGILQYTDLLCFRKPAEKFHIALDAQFLDQQLERRQSITFLPYDPQSSVRKQTNHLRKCAQQRDELLSSSLDLSQHRHNTDNVEGPAVPQRARLVGFCINRQRNKPDISTNRKGARLLSSMAGDGQNPIGTTQCLPNEGTSHPGAGIKPELSLNALIIVN